MPISQESLLLISMPNSAITVSQMHLPSKTHFQKAVGGVKKFFCGHSSRMKVGLQRYSNLTIRYVSRYLPHDKIRIAIHF